MKFIEKLKLKRSKISLSTEMEFIGIFRLENKQAEEVVIRLLDLKHVIERLHLRFGLKASEIAKYLNLRERSVKKLMEMPFTEEKTEV